MSWGSIEGQGETKEADVSDPHRSLARSPVIQRSTVDHLYKTTEENGRLASSKGFPK